jgi:hypothetical protein
MHLCGMLAVMWRRLQVRFALKIPWPKGCEGSSPSVRTMIFSSV